MSNYKMIKDLITFRMISLKKIGGMKDTIV